MAKNGLCPRQARFVKEYVVDLNATAAAKRAGYAEKTAHVQGPRLLGNVRITAALAKEAAKAAERVELTQDMVLRELMAIAFADVGTYTAWGRNGVQLIDSTELTPLQRKAISEVSETVTQGGGTLRFKLHDKQKALELLGKHLGMFKEGPAVEVNNYVVEVPPRESTAEAWRQRFAVSPN
jgi:phage terminase small subunit